MLLCLSMARTMFFVFNLRSSGKGVLGLLLGADTTGKGHSGVEGQALIRSRGQRVKVGPGAADKSLEGQHLGAAAD
jgi:hypothetical protein